jgi:hypothetical protein
MVKTKRKLSRVSFTNIGVTDETLARDYTKMPGVKNYYVNEKCEVFSLLRRLSSQDGNYLRQVKKCRPGTFGTRIKLQTEDGEWIYPYLAVKLYETFTGKEVSDNKYVPLVDATKPLSVENLGEPMDKPYPDSRGSYRAHMHDRPTNVPRFSEDDEAPATRGSVKKVPTIVPKYSKKYRVYFANTDAYEHIGMDHLCDDARAEIEFNEIAYTNGQYRINKQGDVIHKIAGCWKLSRRLWFRNQPCVSIEFAKQVGELTKMRRSIVPLLNVMAETFLGPTPHGCVPVCVNTNQNDLNVSNIVYVSKRQEKDYKPTIVDPNKEPEALAPKIEGKVEKVEQVTETVVSANAKPLTGEEYVENYLRQKFLADVLAKNGLVLIGREQLKTMRDTFLVFVGAIDAALNDK